MLLRYSLVAAILCLGLTEDTRVNEQDKKACRELREEYTNVCAISSNKRLDEKEKEFCQAFEHICFKISDSSKNKMESMKEDDAPIPIGQDADDSSSKKKKRVDFTKFCKQFKNRFLYICPDPFRFGQKAIVFCPIYSERCNLSVPEHPVLPQKKSKGPSGIDKICRGYRGFAQNYCNNPLLTAQPRYREACDKYWKFCGHRNG